MLSPSSQIKCLQLNGIKRLNLVVILVLFSIINQFSLANSSSSNHKNDPHRYFIDNTISNNQILNDRPSYQSINFTNKMSNSEILKQNYEIISNQLNLNKIYDSYTILFGAHSKVWFLAKHYDRSIKKSESDVFTSGDHGLTLRTDFLSHLEKKIDGIFVNQYHREIVIP